MKVTITIDNATCTPDILRAVENAWAWGHFGDPEGELYRGHRQFDAFGCEMTYTCTEEQP